MKRLTSWLALLIACLTLFSRPLAAQVTLSSLKYLDASIIEVGFSQMMFNRRTGEQSMTATLTNVSGDSIVSQDSKLYLAMENITAPQVTVANPDGISTEGIPYYLLDIASGLGTGASVQVRIVFHNPQRVRFDVDANPYIQPQSVPSNHRPIADAGNDINSLVGAELRLDGSGSYDPDGDLITYTWTPTVWPSGSTATPSSAAVPNPRFTPDVAGEYELELLVDDRQVDSEPAAVTVTAFDGVAPPNARAGHDQNALLDSTVSLDGSESNDPNDLPITFAWSVVEVPTGSTATLSSSDTAHPEFVPDVAGTYVLNLRVDNGAGLFDEDSVQVFASEPNVQPTADAGPKKAARTGEVVTLDGTGSFDPDNGPQALGYSWSLVTRPPGSALTSQAIGNASTANPTLTLDTEGPYISRLEVDDGAASDEDNVLVVADDTPPEIIITTPADGTVVTTPRPSIDITFSDGNSGIDPSSFAARLDGVEIQGKRINPR